MNGNRKSKRVVRARMSLYHNQVRESSSTRTESVARVDCEAYAEEVENATDHREQGRPSREVWPDTRPMHQEEA